MIVIPGGYLSSCFVCLPAGQQRTESYGRVSLKLTGKVRGDQILVVIRVQDRIEGFFTITRIGQTVLHLANTKNVLGPIVLLYSLAGSTVVGKG